MKKVNELVTKEWLASKIEINAAFIIGRALVAIFRNQTMEERANNETILLNGIGFSANDSRIGSIGAKYFLKHGTLLDWQLKAWIKKDKKGYPRIVKYAKQLNAIANAKLQSKQGLHA